MAKYVGLSRRRVLAGALGAGGLGVLVACGNQMNEIQNAPYATNAARNTGGTTADAVATSNGAAATPAVSGSAVATMDHTTGTQSAGTTNPASATAAPAKD